MITVRLQTYIKPGQGQPLSCKISICNDPKYNAALRALLMSLTMNAMEPVLQIVYGLVESSVTLAGMSQNCGGKRVCSATDPTTRTHSVSLRNGVLHNRQELLSLFTIHCHTDVNSVATAIEGAVHVLRLRHNFLACCHTHCIITDVQHIFFLPVI